MSSRGEADFAHLPAGAARLYDWLLKIGPAETQTQEIAQDLVSRLDAGRVLDVGTGPGMLLLELHRLNSSFELFGLDISAAMVQRARKNLEGFCVDVRQGSIRETDYLCDYFDAITCVGSFYLWDQPAECTNEIYRILKAGCSAYFWESYRDYDVRDFRRALDANLATVDPVRRLISRMALRKQLAMTYSTEEFAQILDHTRFAGAHTLAKVTLARLPIWLRIELSKTAEV